MIIEYGHIYVADIMSNSIDVSGIRKGMDLARDVASPSDLLVVLIDDKEHSLTPDERRYYGQFVMGLYADLGLAPHEIHFEKVFAAHAEGFIEAIPSEIVAVERFRKQNKHVTFARNGLRRIPLKSVSLDQVAYSCPLLASLWRKHKEAMAHMHGHTGTLTILDSRFRRVEDDVEFLSSLFPSLSGCRHEYLWY